MNLDELIRQVTEEVVAKAAGQSVPAAAGDYSPASLAKYVDHTLLKPAASRDQVKKVCDEARANKFASVCVNPNYIEFVAQQLSGSGVAPCVVIGFPLGATTPEVKAAETSAVVALGAKEVDMVVNIGAIKSGDWKLVKRDIEAVTAAARGKALVKTIIETCLLTDEEKVKVCTVAKLAGADFVKTSTGFSTGGATVEDVRLMRQTVGPDIGVKASGGVKDYASAVKMIKAGATRLGTSSGVKIVTGDVDEEHVCINCGACTGTCPTSNVTLTKTAY
ncbi:MAG: deoxyribose-phosphate aldolase [Clostridia bacterium]|jgi:deoxyribose-phosphate aldolase|nr:deoxyribose-phosphate aldolase [Clostridia bacterium]MBT7122506.1 deoxyribose-phosphate aldolase [Clostridia bacterium]